MRMLTISAVCGGAALLGSLGAWRALGAQPRFDAAGWSFQLEPAHEASVEQNKPMLLLISAGWCRNCRRLETETLVDPQVADRIRGEFVPVYLDFDRHRRIADALEVTSIPCTVVLNPRADMLARVIGYVDSTQYGLALSRAAELHRRIECVGSGATAGTR